MRQGGTGIVQTARIGAWLILAVLLVALSISERRRAPFRGTEPAPTEPIVTATVTPTIVPEHPLMHPAWTSVESSPASKAMDTVRAFGRWFHEAFVRDVD